MAESNRRRALAELVTAEAWHMAFRDGRTRADLHVDVVFGTGRIGGGDPSGVRFRLSLKRADLVVIIPEHEPAGVDTASVRRDTPKETLGKVETKAKVSRSVGLTLSGAAGASTKGVKADALAKANLSLAVSKNRTVTASQTFRGMPVVQNKTPDGAHRWAISPALGEAFLAGRPWDATKVPRLELLDQRAPGSKSMPPTVRVEVRCLREDLEISQIKLDDESAWSLINRRKAAQTRRIAAEAALRTLLAHEGLIAGDLSDPFAEITLAMTVADVI